jgi:2-hydroxychromene-2-carboxylate isomerase
MDRTLDYYVFPQSPWTYLGHARAVEIARRHGAALRVRPMDGGKVFPVSGGLPLPKRAPQRQAYRLVELERWRRHLGVPLHVEPKYFPVGGDPAARLIVAAEEVSAESAVEVLGRVLAAVWAEQRDIADETTLAALADESGLSGKALVERSKSPEIQARYDAHTQAAIDTQVFGAPTYVWRGELFWGQDRLDFLERALAA